MALRNILTKEEPTLYKKCRPVTAFNARLHQLLDDMADTLKEANGVGLAAPQVGVLRRVVLVIETNVPEGESDYIIELINPEIIETSGVQNGAEGCLSVPERQGVVTRPMKVKVQYQNRHGKPMILETEGFEARAVCHEIDHLNGVLYVDVMDRELSEDEIHGKIPEDGE